MKTIILILKLSFRNFRMEEVRAYMDMVKEITTHIQADQLGETRYEFEKAQNTYTEVIKQVTGSVYTKEVLIADDYRDKIGAGLTTAVRANLNHFDASVAEASRQVQIVLNASKGFNSMPYAQQTATVRDLIENLNSSRYTHMVDEAGVRMWVDELSRANNNFEALYVNRGMEEGTYHIEAGASMVARKNVIEAYNDFIATLNAVLRIKPTKDLENAALSLNEIIRQYQNTIAQRQGIAKAKKEKKAEEEAMKNDESINQLED